MCKTTVAATLLPAPMTTDLRFAFRQLLKSPGFTFLAVITLALGIGLNTAIFSVINDLFLRGLPFSEPERVVHILAGDKGRMGDKINLPLGAPRFLHYRDGQTIFSGFAAENGLAATLTGLGDPVQLPVFKVTANWFDVLGVRPLLGRNFLPAEEEGADVAMVTQNFWRKRLGGDPNVIGRSITLDGVRTLSWACSRTCRRHGSAPTVTKSGRPNLSSFQDSPTSA